MTRILIDKTIIYLAVVFFTFSMYAVYPQSSDGFDRIFDKGIEYERQNKLEKAVEMYRKALKMNKMNNQVKVRLAKVLSWQDKYEEALTILDEVLQDEQYHSEALFRKAQILSWQGKYEESIATYQIYLMKDKDDGDALMGIARVYFWSGQNEKAIDYFNQAINAGADEIDARMNLGKVYLAMGDKVTAKEEFNKVLQLDPGNKEAKRFLIGMRTLKTYEITLLNLIWSIYRDKTLGVTASSGITYHYKQKWDFGFFIENAIIDKTHDLTLSFSTFYRGVQYLYLLGGISLTPNADFSSRFSINLGANYSLKNLFNVGLNFKTEIFPDDTLFTISPELQRYFSDITYVALGYNQYIYKSGYYTGTIGLHLNFEYYDKNPIFVYLIYGGDVEIKDKDRRIFNLGAGISYNFTDNFELSLGYALLGTEYGRTHEISNRFILKW